MNFLDLIGTKVVMLCVIVLIFFLGKMVKFGEK